MIEDDIRSIINGWVVEEAPSTIRMSILPEHKESLLRRLKVYVENKCYSSYDDGYNDRAQDERLRG